MAGLWYRFTEELEMGLLSQRHSLFRQICPCKWEKGLMKCNGENAPACAYSSDLCLKGSDHSEQSGRRALTCSPSPAHSCGGWRHPEGSAARRLLIVEPSWLILTSYSHAEDE